MPENPDLAIAQAATVQPIAEVADRAGIPAGAVIPYGRTKAKIDVAALPARSSSRPQPRLVLVTAISPTPAGEGKSTVTVGLADAFSQRGDRTMVALREPSLGPVMGIKGGAAGGGYAQIVPMEDINLHFTGDLHAITAADNLLSALIDNHIHQGNELGIDPRRIVWKRVLDMNDRALRGVVVGLGGPTQGVPREDGFDITVASEIMAIFCLATSVSDLRARLSRILVAYTFGREPVTVADLGAEGALTLLLKDALNPNLVQTLGGTPALVHGGPFANIAHGCNSILATQTARQLADVVVTEAGFGSDLGAEKFLDIKCRFGGFMPDGVVIVATARALKHHGGVAFADLTQEDVEALESGLVNLSRHVDNMRRYGLAPVVAINRFVSDTDAELAAIETWCRRKGVRCALTEVWAKGGEGGLALADQVRASFDEVRNPHLLYGVESSVRAKLHTLATQIYGADGVEFSSAAEKKLAMIEKHGWADMPVCVAKTQYSFSDDPDLLGAPVGHSLHVRDLVPKLGAGFIVALTGDIMTMPGLPKHPAALRMDVDAEGRAVGLF